MKTAPGVMPNVAILLTSVLWGTLWIPMREMNESGMNGATATTASFLLGLLILLPFGLVKGRRIWDGGRPLLAAGLLMAISVALYAEGLVRGQVARVMLLFYLTPVWSTLLGRLLLDEPITRRRVVAIVLGLTGMVVILGIDAGLPVPRSVADWMGLASGVVWGMAMAYIHRSASRKLFDRIFVSFVFLAPVYYLLTLIPGSRDALGVEGAPLASSVVMLVALALVWIVPTIWLTVYGASVLDPGRVAIFLMFEIIIGLATAALLIDEPFGWRELIGATLIATATVAEFVGKPGARVAPRH